MRKQVIYSVLCNLIVCALIALSSVAAASSAFAQEAQPILGTTLSAIPPKNFKPASDFPGFIDQSVGGTIVVVELPKEAFDEYSTLFSDTKKLNRKFARAGIQMSRVVSLTTSGGQKVNLAQGIHKVSNGQFDMWAAVYKGDMTALVTLKLPKKGVLTTSEIESFFESVRPGRVVTANEFLSILPYEVSVVEPFRMVGTPSALGAVLTVGSDDLNRNNLQPTIMIFHKAGIVLAGDLDRTAEIELRSTSSFRDSDIQKRQPIRFAGGEGIFFEGVTTLKGVTKKFSQRFVVGPRSHSIRMVVVGDKAQMEEFGPIADRISSSVAFKKNN